MARVTHIVSSMEFHGLESQGLGLEQTRSPNKGNMQRGRWTHMLRLLGHTAGRHRALAVTSNTSWLRTGVAFAHKGCNDNEHSKIPQQVLHMPTAEPTGFGLVLSRTSNILLNIAEVVMSKVLYLYCDAGGGLITLLGQSSKFDITGCSYDRAIIEACSKLKQYTAVDSLEISEAAPHLPYRPRCFEIIVSLYPFYSDKTPQPMVAVSEVSRVLGDKGFAVFGAPEDDWRRFGVQQALDARSDLSVLSMQKIRCPEQGSSYVLSLVRKHI